MADENITAPQAPAAPASAAAAPPPVVESAPAPVAAAPVAPAAVETPAPAAPPAAAPVASTEAPGAKEPAAVAKTAPLLSAEPVKTDAKTDAKVVPLNADKPAETKAEDAKAGDAKPVEQKKEDGSQSAEPAPTPTYEAFKLPDGLSADGKLGEFTKILSDIEFAKGDHAKMQEYGQKLVDRHIAEVQGALKTQGEYYINAFEQQKTDWLAKTKADPEIGGNRFETAVNAANEFISTHGGTEAQQKELRDLLGATGVEYHPAIVRVFAKAMTNMKEGKPLPASRPEARPQSKVEKRYGKTTS